MNHAILNQVKQTVADVLSVDVEEIDNDVNLMETFGLDSLEVVDIASRLEEEFSVSIDPSAFPRMSSIESIVELLDACAGQSAATAAA